MLALAQAQPITVNRGETMAGVEVMLAEGIPTVVTGTVLRSDGQPVTGGSVSTRVIGNEATGGFDSGGGTGLRPGGSFRLTLAPGDYSLDAQVMTRQGPGPMGPDDQLFGSMRISVGSGPTEAVTVMVGRGASASGRVVFEDHAASAASSRTDARPALQSRKVPGAGADRSRWPPTGRSSSMV